VSGLWLLGLLACGWGGPRAFDPGEAVAYDADLRTLVADHPGAGWQLDGEPARVGGATVWAGASLRCTTCSDECKPLLLGVERGVSAASSVVAVQPMTAEVSVKRTLEVAEVAVVPWPEGWALDGPEGLVRRGAWAVVPGPGLVELSGGGDVPPEGVVNPHEVVLPASALGLRGRVRLKDIPAMSLVGPLPPTWEGSEAVVAYHRPQTVSEGRMRLQGTADPSTLRARLAELEAARQRWPGLAEGPWLHFVWSGTRLVAQARGLLVPASGPVSWAELALPDGATPRLVAAAIAFDLGLRGEVTCLGLRSMTVAEAGPAGGAVLADLAERMGDDAVRELLVGLADPSWAGLRDAVPEPHRSWLDSRI